MKPESKVVEYPAEMTRLPNQSGPDIDDDTIDIRDLFLKVWRGKWIILICMLLCLVLAVLGTSQLEPRYKSSTKVMVDAPEANIVNVQEVIVNPEFGGDTLQNEVEVLRSTTLIERVIDQLNLTRNPQFNTALQEKTPTIFERLNEFVAVPPEVTDLLMDVGVIAPPPPPVDEETQAEATRLRVIDAVLDGLSVSPVRGSRVLQLSYTSNNPRTSARLVNAIAKQYIVDQLEARLETTRAATEWLTVRVEELEERVQVSEEAVEAKRAELSEQAGQSLQITEQQLQALNQSLNETRSDIAILTSQYDRLNQALAANRDLASVSEFRRSILIQEYRRDESDLMDRLLSLSQNHPARREIEAQVANIRERMRSEAVQIVEAIGNDLEALYAQEDALMETVRETEAKVFEQSREEVQLRQLEREAQASRLLYENFLGRLKETTAQEDLETANARILSPAEPPLYAESRRKKQIILIAGIVGGMMGVGIVLLLDHLNNTFRSPQQLEDMTGLAVLATVPAIGSRIRRGDVIKNLREKPNSSLAEAIRNLRTSILFSNMDNPPKVVMFTSSVPREAKSTTSMLTAITSRQMGKSAIIVDCDLRLPSLAKLLKTDDTAPGLLSVLEGAASLDEAIYKDADAGLHVLMTRKREQQAQINAADILSSQRFKDLIGKLSRHYDLVILDTPPALVVADARILSSIADAVVYAVRWDDTPRGAVLEGLKELKSVKAPIAGLVLTLVNESRAAKYAYDGYNYYKGRYKDYYVS